MSLNQRDRTTVGSLVFTGILWLLAAVIFVGAFSFAHPANLAPLILGGAALALLSWLLVGETVGRLRTTSSAPAKPGMPVSPPAPGDDRAEVAALAWTTGTIVLLVVFGFLIGVTAGMIGILRLYARETWRMTIATTAIVIATLYVSFGVLLDVPFFPGILGIGP